MKWIYAGVDLNLLKLLDALLRERSVTRAGQRLGLSQPAASRALGRLRRLLADRIVVRTPQGLELTPRAAALAEPVARLLEGARAIVAPAAFDPATARGRVTIAGVDYTTLLVMPALVARLSRLAPGLDLEIPPLVGDHAELIAADAADLALGVYDDAAGRLLPPGALRRGPGLRRPPRPSGDRGGADAGALRRPVASAMIITGRGEAPVDVALARHGLTRRVALRLPHFIAAPMLVARERHDPVAAAPAGARIAATRRRMRCWSCRSRSEPLTVSMIWHERRQDDPAHAWLRRQVAEAMREFDRPDAADRL